MAFYQQGKCMHMSPEYLGTGGGQAVPEGPYDVLADDIIVILMDETYSVNLSTHVDYADISATSFENIGGGVSNYTGRGQALGSKTVVMDVANTRAEFDAADEVFTGLGNGTNDTFDQIVLARERATTPADGDTVLIAHAIVPATLTNGGNVTLTFNAQGILQLS